MGKKVVLFSVLFSLILIIPLVLGAEVNNSKVDKAYICLDDKIRSRTCADLSSEERIFALLASGKNVDLKLMMMHKMVNVGQSQDVM